jgi:hypothetical protein
MQDGVGTNENEHHMKGILKQENVTLHAIVLAHLKQSGNSHTAHILRIPVCTQHSWRVTKLNENKYHEEFV